LVAPWRQVSSVPFDSRYQLDSDWVAAACLNESGAILVRPDGHIAVSVPDDSPQSQQRVRDAFERLLPAPPSGQA
jgi:hypothetical protein